MLVSVSIVPEVVHGKESRKVNSGESIEEHENASEKDRLEKLGKDTRLAVIMLSTDSLYIELVVFTATGETSPLPLLVQNIPGNLESPMRTAQ